MTPSPPSPRGEGEASRLELKVPPPVVALLIGAAMYGADRAAPALRFEFAGRTVLAGLLAASGVALAIAAAIGLLLQRTTIDPRKPGKTSALVTRGVYRWSRNPIYLGDTLLLLGWALYLGNALAVALAPAFVVWMNAFQIKPEEAVLRGRFAGAYDEYCRRVDRWLGRRRGDR